jgi:hypothetical protein
VAVKSILDAAVFHEDVQFSDTDLDGAIREQASLFARYSALHAEAAEQASTKKAIYEVIRAKAAKKVREDAATAGTKVTDSLIEQEVTLTGEVLNARLDMIRADSILDLCKNALKAFEQRRDMLIQRGSSIREELKGELRIHAVTEARTNDRAALLERMRTSLSKPTTETLAS